MEDYDYPVNRSDANRPEEVNPWKEHVIENDPTHKEPRDIPSPGDVPLEHDKPYQDDMARVNRAGKEIIREKNSIPPEIFTRRPGPASAARIEG